MIDFNRGRVFYICVTSRDNLFLLYFNSRAEEISMYYCKFGNFRKGFT